MEEDRLDGENLVGVGIGLEEEEGETGCLGDEREGHPRQKTESQHPLLLPRDVRTSLVDRTGGEKTGLDRTGLVDDVPAPIALMT